MTGPDGEKTNGWWRFAAVEEPRLIEFEDGPRAAMGQIDAALAA